MTFKGIVVATVQFAAVLFLIWIGWVLVRLGFPLQWLAIGVGGTLAGAAALSFLLQPLVDRVAPDLESRRRATMGYSIPRGVQTAMSVAYVVLGGAAAVWGLVNLPA